MVGALTVPVLSLVISPVSAAGLMLPVYVVSDWFGLYAYRREFDKRVLAIACVAMTMGVGLGWATAKLIPESWVTVLVGVISVAFALNQILRRPAVAEPKRAEIRAGTVLVHDCRVHLASSAIPAGRPIRSGPCHWA